MPTIQGLLGGIDSVVTPLKRRVANLFNDPVGDVQQTLGLLDDRAKTFTNALNTSREGGELARMNSVMAGLPQYRQASDYVTNALTNQVMNFAPIGATVWHGSPHKFDKFDASKIGTGEGAQAYGHGIYTAETPDVAKSYMALGHMQGNVSKVGRKPINDVYSQLETAEQQLFGNRYIDQATKNARGRVISDQKAMLEDLMNNGLAPDVLKSARDNGYSPEAVKWFEKQVAPRYQPSGNLYKVDLPDEHIAKMLDWDKPLSQQHPDVQKAIKDYAGWAISGDPKGQEIYDAITKRFGTGVRETLDKRGQSIASSYMRDSLGIPGIRYLDGGSRGAGQGTSNYVVFPGNEGLLNILERNGKPIK